MSPFLTGTFTFECPKTLGSVWIVSNTLVAIQQDEGVAAICSEEYTEMPRPLDGKTKIDAFGMVLQKTQEFSLARILGKRFLVNVLNVILSHVQYTTQK